MTIVRNIIKALKYTRNWKRLYSLQRTSQTFNDEIEKQHIFKRKIGFLGKIYSIDKLKNMFSNLLIKILMRPLNIRYHYLNRIDNIKDKINHLLVITKLFRDVDNTRYITYVHKSMDKNYIKLLSYFYKCDVPYKTLNLKDYYVLKKKIQYLNLSTEWIFLCLISINYTTIEDLRII